MVWRLLHGKLFVEALTGTSTGARQSHTSACQEQLATLSHVMLSCPVSQAVWQWFGDVWTAVCDPAASMQICC